MELNDIMKMQLQFDKKHQGSFNWAKEIKSDDLQMLGFLIIAIVGEVGELSNIVKKVLRGDFSLDEKKDEIEEEITDIFIYLIKICNQMNLNLEQNYLKKLKINAKVFKHYESE